MPSYLGQNFLKDISYINFIVQKIEKFCTEYGLKNIIEIGPGKCALTRKLLQLDKKLILFERDTELCDLIESTTEGANVDIIRGDVLEQDPVEVLKKSGLQAAETLVAGNLPYYITSPIMVQFFGGEDPKFHAGIFMVQKEVADKVKIDAEKKSFLRWLLNYHFDVRYLKTVPAKAFSPAPKVQSAVIGLTRKENVPRCSYEQTRVLLERISMYKRKTLGKSRKMAGAEKGDNDALLLVLGDYRYSLPTKLQSKRIEDVSWEELEKICE